MELDWASSYWNAWENWIERLILYFLTRLKNNGRYQLNKKAYHKIPYVDNNGYSI